MQTKDMSSNNIPSDWAVKSRSLASVKSKPKSKICSKVSNSSHAVHTGGSSPSMKRCVSQWMTNVEPSDNSLFSSVTTITRNSILQLWKDIIYFCLDDIHPTPIAKTLKEIYPHMVLGLRRECRHMGMEGRRNNSISVCMSSDLNNLNKFYK